MTKELCSQKLNCCESLETFLASQLTIGIGEVLRRIIEKAVMSVVKKESVQTGSSLQICASQVAGVKSTNNSMVDLFESDNSDAVL